MNKLFWLSSLLLISFLSEGAFAARRDARQVVQRARIHEGVVSGELTAAERRRLNAGHRHVRRLERRAEADGQVTVNEKVRIEKAQDRQSRRIYRQKHDAQAANN